MDDHSEQLSWIDQQQPVMVQRVIDWCNINSFTHHLPGLARVGNEAANVLRSLGASIEWIELPAAATIDGRGQLVHLPLGRALRARKRPQAKRSVLLGIHLDTVYPPDDAFQKVRWLDHNTLNGPGVIDAKGGLVVLLTALEAFERSPLAEQIGWEVLLNPDEEISSPGAGFLFEQAAARHEIGLLFEPAMGSGNLVDAHKGSGTFTLVVHGRAAHAGRDFSAGRNAVVALAEVITLIHAINDRLQSVTVNVGRFEGGGAVNIVPDLAIARINVRVATAEDEAFLIAQLTAVVSQLNRQEGIRAQLHGGVTSPPKPLDSKTKALLDQVLAAAHMLGLDINSEPSGGTSDGNKLAAAGLPTIDSLGPRGGKMHSCEEYLLIDSLKERAKLTTTVLMHFAKQM